MEDKLRLNNLFAPSGANKRKKRLGRGVGSGHGKTSGKGHKGEKARSGGNIKPGFEGGQMPLIRRLPKFGFNPLYRERIQIVDVGSLNIFKENEVVTPEILKDKGLVKSTLKKIKILGDGELKKNLTVKSDSFSNSAIEKIISIGGKALDRKGVEVAKKIKIKIAPKPKVALEPKVQASLPKEKVGKKEKSQAVPPPAVKKEKTPEPPKGKPR